MRSKIESQLLKLERQLRKQKTKQQSVLWTAYHSVLVVELAVVILLLTMILQKGGA